MRLGLVTHLWGAEWDLPSLLDNCRQSGFEGVELRTSHKHGVELGLSSAERDAVASRFAESGVTLVGFGTTCEFHSSDAAEVERNIEEGKRWIELAHDCGAGGIKVRPNGLPADVPVGKTLEQIGRAMRVLAEHGEGFGVEIRLEIHGKRTSELPNIKRIMDVADHPYAKVCWNSNETDLAGKGLEHNFNLVRDRLGTIHIHDLTTDYPWRPLFTLLNDANFEGWTLLEDGDVPTDPVRVMKYYHLLWDEWTKA